MSSSGVMMMSSFSLKPSLLSVEKASIARPSNSKLIVKASGGKKITTDKPYGMSLVLPYSIICKTHRK